MEPTELKIPKKIKGSGEKNPGDGDLTHYLGNDDYLKKEVKVNNAKLDGFEASGNEDDDSDLNIDEDWRLIE